MSRTRHQYFNLSTLFQFFITEAINILYFFRFSRLFLSYSFCRSFLFQFFYFAYSVFVFISCGYLFLSVSFVSFLFISCNFFYFSYSVFIFLSCGYLFLSVSFVSFLFLFLLVRCLSA